VSKGLTWIDSFGLNL